MTPKESLERILELLPQLYSDEARAKLIDDLVDRGYATYKVKDVGARIPQQFLDKTIETYLKAGKIEIAANFAERAGMKKKARELCGKITMYGRIAEEFVNKEYFEYFERVAEMTDGSRDSTKAIEMLENAGNFSSAAGMASRLGLKKRAIDDYVQAGDLTSAAQIAEGAGMKKRAQGLYASALEQHEQKGDFYRAAEAAKSLGLKEKALEYYQKIHNLGINEHLEIAWLIIELHGITPEAQYHMSKVMEYEEIGRDFYSAGHRAETLGMLDRMKMYKELYKLRGQLLNGIFY